MKRVTRIFGVIGLVVMFGISNAAYAACEFLLLDPDAQDPGYSPPDGVSDLSGQGNFTCAEFTGSNGAAMTEVTGVVFQRNGDWDLPIGARVFDTDPLSPSFGLVRNTPDHIVEFPQGNGSRCSFIYFRNNTLAGRGLDIGGNVDRQDSIACTDSLVNNIEPVEIGEPDIVTTGDNCVVTLEEDSTDITSNFDYFTGSNLEGTIQAVCSADGTPQNECVRGCPDFIDIEQYQNVGLCQPDTNGFIPLTDSGITDPENPGQRCTPCLTGAQAKMQDPSFDTGGLKLCWEYTNGVDTVAGNYRPHKSIRSQTTETDLFNECYQTTVTVNFFGREIIKTITTCD